MAQVERLLSRQELAQALGVSPDTVKRETARGKLRVHRIGRLVRYRYSEALADTAEAPMTGPAAVARALRQVR